MEIVWRNKWCGGTINREVRLGKICWVTCEEVKGILFVLFISRAKCYGLLHLFDPMMCWWEYTMRTRILVYRNRISVISLTLWHLPLTSEHVGKLRHFAVFRVHCFSKWPWASDLPLVDPMTHVSYPMAQVWDEHEPIPILPLGRMSMARGVQ